MGVIYPCVLQAITPYGIADFTVIGPPPGAFVAVDQRKVELDVSVTGNPILTLPPPTPYYQLRLNITQDTPVSYEVAAILQRCQFGDIVSWVESHTKRDRIRYWDSQVISPDAGQWVVGNAEQGDWYSVSMLCHAATGPTEA